MKWQSGTKHSPEHDNRATYQSPATYTFYEDDSLYYGESQSPDFSDITSNSNPSTVLNNIFSALDGVGGSVCIQGSHNFSTTLRPKDHTTIFGDGESSVLGWNGATTSTLMTVNAEDYVTIRDLKFNTAVDYIQALELANVDDVYIQRCKFTGFYRHAIFAYAYSADINNLHITDNVFDNAGSGTNELAAWDCNSVIALIPRAGNKIKNVWIERNDFQQTRKQDGIDMRAYERAAGNGIENLYILNNNFYDINVCWDWHGVINNYVAGTENLHIKGNTIVTVTNPTYWQTGIVVSSEACTDLSFITKNVFLLDNYVDNSDLSKTYDGILVHGYDIGADSTPPYNLRSVQILGNKVYNVDHNAISFGYANDLTINDNISDTAGVYGFCLSAGYDCTCTGNIAKNCDTTGIVVCNCGGTTVSGNTVDDDRTVPLMVNGIWEYDTVNLCADNSIVGNVIKNAQTAYVKISDDTLCRVHRNVGYNPVGKVATPFDNVNHYIELNGAVANPAHAGVGAQKYVVCNCDVYISSTDSGDSNCDIQIYDPSDNALLQSTLSTIDHMYLPVGYKIDWGVYSGAEPTITVSFC